ncbi:hypothetical protein [Pseudonocardia sp. NPDC049154]|uniref:hypothetical protein n=1 Tax=Pseudonocardia sp. NPDC049154 TaxID=3155501 RepID=UPI00340AB79C
MIDFEKVGLAMERDRLQDRVSELEAEVLRLQALLKIADKPAPVEKVNPFPGQAVGVVDFTWADYGGPEQIELYELNEGADLELLDAINLVTSVVEGHTELLDEHKIVLDIDHPVRVLESSTPGHHHLFIDKAVSWAKYQHVLHALAVAGVVEPGYVAASIDRGCTAVRLPWVKKGEQA